MPRASATSSRRDQISEAVLRVIAEQGLPGVSLRHVAAAAEVSMGMVQHHFATKQAMLDYAMKRVVTDAHRRAAEEIGQASTPREQVRALLVQMLPLDEQRTRELRIVMCRTSYMVTRPDLHAALCAESRSFHNGMAAGIRAAPGAAQGHDPDQAAAVLIASVSGLALQVLAGGCSGDTALAVLEGLLDQVFGPTEDVECSRDSCTDR